MDRYLAYLNDTNQIHRSQDSLIRKCENWSRIRFAVYRSFDFIDGTGFALTVFDEIAFVLKCQQRKRINILGVEDFIQAWGLMPYAGYELASLSGGWKKYLGVALFTNQRSKGKIFLDMSRHLADTLLGLFFKNLGLCDDEIVVFFEYDIHPMCNPNYGLKSLYDLGDRLSSIPWYSDSDRRKLETNYD